MRNTIRRAIEDFVWSIDDFIDVDFNTSEFCVDIENECVFIPLDPREEESKMFMDFIGEEYGEYDMDADVLGILHEIGHIFTYDESLARAREVKVLRLRLDFDAAASNLKEYNFAYFRIPAEIYATDWAVDYYNMNREKCDALAAALKTEKGIA